MEISNTSLAWTVRTHIIEVFEVPPFGCNCTIVGDLQDQRAVCVDPGGDVSKILKILSKYRLSLAQILITHGHLDHVLAANELRRQTCAAVFMHQDDLLLWTRVSAQCEHFGLRAPTEPLAIVDCFAAHNDIVKCGDHLSCRCLHTPGHTAGSVSWLIEHTAGRPLLCSGDTLFAGSIGRTTFFDCPALDNRSNQSQLVNSIQNRLFCLPDETPVVCGHGPSTTIGKEKETNPFVGAAVFTRASHRPSLENRDCPP